MAKYTKEQVVAERKCGLRYFDDAVTKVGREGLIQKGVELAKKYPGTWGDGWPNFSWALGNAIIEVLDPKGDISQTWNIDEALTAEELSFVAKELGITTQHEITWARKGQPKPRVL